MAATTGPAEVTRAEMQTFLPYADFAASARTLDMRRLGKQRVETYQILKALTIPTYGWQSHPAVKMWRGYEEALRMYGWAICREWKARGYKDTVQARFEADLIGDFTLPPWIGMEELHDSHKSNLIRKFPEHYRPLFPDVALDLEYVWPVQ